MKSKKLFYEKPKIVQEVVFAPRSGACQQVPPTIYESLESNVTGECGNLDGSVEQCSVPFGQWLK